MNTEIEAKFINCDHKRIRHSLKELGATLKHPTRLMRRVIIDTPTMEKKNAHLRIRDEGDKITATYKQFGSKTIDGVKEIEINVSDFETTIALFAAAGLVQSSYQETRRETWQLGEVEVVLDLWPWLNPFIEIEGLDDTSVKEAASMLGFEWKNAVFGGVLEAYRAQYPLMSPSDTVASLPFVRFEDPLPDMLRS